MENLYIININTLPDPMVCPEAMEGLPQNRKKRCLRYFDADDRKRCLGAGRLIKHILKDRPLYISENGKPVSEGICFSISHSGDYVIGAASDREIGCDIERISTGSIYVADRYFWESERSYIEAQTDRDKAFKQLWTLKEAYLKMTGAGVAGNLRKTEIAINDGMNVFYDKKLQSCRCESLVIDGYMVAICSENPDFEIDKLNIIYM